MQINDVIREAPTEAAVYFLLSAYIDAVWQEGGDAGVRVVMGGLPLSGIDDVEARYNLLKARAERQGNLDRSDAIGESLEVFSAAASRLRSLHGLRP